jgi:hypothetical protein
VPHRKISTMKNIPTTLKRLAEKRARVAGELQNTEQVVVQMTSDIATLNQKLVKVQILLEMAENHRAELIEDLSTVDRYITNFDKNVKPERIGPIRAWKGKYGKRGTLRQFLIDTIQSRAPEFVPTTELSRLAILEFSLSFAHRDLLATWHANCLRGALKILVTQGYIERSHEVVRSSNEFGSWRWKQAIQPTLAQLAQLTCPL